ncbi:MAG: hypothetical protein ABWZ63_08565 [Thermoleophilaceae bacterium]
MAFFSRRDSGNRTLGKSLEADIRDLERLASLYTGMGPDKVFDLRAYSMKAFETAPTRDIFYLLEHGCDGREFHARELEPNWAGLDRDQRLAKIASFVKFANLLAKSPEAGDHIAELRATAQTKIALLVTAFDETYKADLGRQISRNPGSFGDYGLPDALAHG